MKIIGMHAEVIALQTKATLEKRGYAFFDGSKSLNLNIVGVRNDITKSNSFDDMLLVVCRNAKLEWEVYSYRITTDPGSYWLKNPENVKGTAILVPGQYRSVYKIDKHQGSYEALCQRNGNVKVWRDSNKNEELDFNVSVDTGMFGINIHRSAKAGESTQVDRWSAGCQVFKNSSDFDEFMALCKSAVAAGRGDTFTYTLLEKKDLV